MALTDALMQAVAGAPPAHRTSYAGAFEAQFGLCPHTASCAQLAAATRAARIEVPKGLPPEARDEWLNLLLATKIEPQLGRDRPELLYHYPATQAALAKTVRRDDGIVVAERFELYWQGVELANGYHELTDAAELRRRLEQVNRLRLNDGRPALPLPESLLAAMQAGLPPSAGCALGFDRLAMLILGAKSIKEVIPGEP
jgi:lysyl-tRNA synthetase class 2